jgi:hypothetical protein
MNAENERNLRIMKLNYTTYCGVEDGKMDRTDGTKKITIVALNEQTVLDDALSKIDAGVSSGNRVLIRVEHQAMRRIAEQYRGITGVVIRESLNEAKASPRMEDRDRPFDLSEFQTMQQGRDSARARTDAEFNQFEDRLITDLRSVPGLGVPRSVPASLIDFEIVMDGAVARLHRLPAAMIPEVEIISADGQAGLDMLEAIYARLKARGYTLRRVLMTPQQSGKSVLSVMDRAPSYESVLAESRLQWTARGLKVFQFINSWARRNGWERLTATLPEAMGRDGHVWIKRVYPFNSREFSQDWWDTELSSGRRSDLMRKYSVGDYASYAANRSANYDVELADVRGQQSWIVRNVSDKFAIDIRVSSDNGDFLVVLPLTTKVVGWDLPSTRESKSSLAESILDWADVVISSRFKTVELFADSVSEVSDTLAIFRRWICAHNFSIIQGPKLIQTSSLPRNQIRRGMGDQVGYVKMEWIPYSDNATFPDRDDAIGIDRVLLVCYDLKMVRAMELEAVQEDAATGNQVAVALKTLRMADAILGVMGGMTKTEAEKVLLQNGYTPTEVSAIRQGIAPPTKSPRTRRVATKYHKFESVDEAMAIKVYMNGDLGIPGGPYHVISCSDSTVSLSSDESGRTYQIPRRAFEAKYGPVHGGFTAI